MRKIVTLAVSAALVAMFVPGTAPANHCADNNLLIFSGVQGAPKVNGGAAQCSTPSLAHVANAKVLTPGATHLNVGAIFRCADGTRKEECKPAAGTLQFLPDGDVQTIEWTWQAQNDLGQVTDRWISVEFEIPAGATGVKATATLPNAEGELTDYETEYVRV